MLAERIRQPFADLADFQLRAKLPKASLRTLAEIGALKSLSPHRRDAMWRVEERLDPDDLFSRVPVSEAMPLPAMDRDERVSADYRGTGLTTGAHPVALIRDQIPDVWTAAEIAGAKHGTVLTIGGQVICRQRPGTAHGFVFISLEDETGVANAIVTPQLFEQCRLLISEEPFLRIVGVLQNVEKVIHVKAREIGPLRAGDLPAAQSHDFH